VNSYARLEAWKAAHHLVLLIYRTTKAFPPAERFGLCSQLRRAAFAVAANIAEGSGRRAVRQSVGAASFTRLLDGSFTEAYETPQS
jgi:four helix bundle protein